MKLRVVFDTNVFLSALLFEGKAREALLLVRSGKAQLITSPEILSETARKLREKFQWPEHQVQRFLRLSAKEAELVKPTRRLAVVVNDEEDNRILECASEGKADLILSGDRHLLDLRSFQNIPIQKPAYLLLLQRREPKVD